VTENAGEGTDTVQSSITYTLGANVENLTLTGASAINGTGNTLANSLTGNSAANILNGGTGGDTMAGGDGNDVYYVDNAGDAVSETNAVLATGGTDTVYSYLSTYLLGANVENLRIVTSGVANGTGNGLANTLFAGAGNNVLDGGAGTDTASYIYATAGVTASLASPVAQATGGSGSDVLLNFENLTGSNYNDTLTGNSGNNVLIGGLGKDTLKGGLGADMFRLNSAAESDVGILRDSIQDFSAAQGDKIYLSSIDANSTLAGNQAFTSFAQGASFSGSFAAQASLYFDQTAHVLYGNNDADATADFSVALVGVASLTAGSIVA